MPYSIGKWAFIPLYALIFCEIFVNFLDGYLSGVKINLIKIKRENAYRFLSYHKIEYWERKEILTVQHQDNLVILEMLYPDFPIRFL